MLSFLPSKIRLFLNEFDLSKIYEIRMRTGYKIKIKYADSIINLANGQVICDKNDIIDTIKNITENSLYAFNESLKKGFLTTRYGVRVGVAGECVYDNGQIITIKNISSLNIRVPHFINDCSKNFFEYIYNERIKNSLIISPPFYGKTTILKDLILKINLLDKYNILIVDERNEFCALKGENIDSIKYCNKNYAFSYGIRSMAPDVIITDELTSKEDWKAIENAIYSGVKVIASCHGDDVFHVKNKDVFINGLFERYVVLDSENGQAGIIKKIYNGDLSLL